jgi:sulfate/thiosulfate transport system permease protein
MKRTRRSLLPALLGAVVAVFLTVVLFVPVAAVLAGALSKGVSAYVSAVTTTEAQSAMQLTLLTAGSSVVLNTLFGVAAAWAITRGSFFGKSVLVTLIDLPLSVSPVISGLVFVVLFGARGFLGPWLMAHGIRVLFTPLALILATVFVTFPFVARELVTVMQAQGIEEEQAAVTLGASGWQVFRRVTLPKIRWGLLYGVLLCNARAMGEFGAVSVVSGHVRGRTNTLPLHVEILYNEYDFAGAFAVASLLLLLAVVTLVLKSIVERRTERGALA